MQYNSIPSGSKMLLTAPAGSRRYGYHDGSSDMDYFGLSEGDVYSTVDRESHIDCFVVSVSTLRYYWGHPLLMGDITGDCSGNDRICTFLVKHRHEITYASPGSTVLHGLDYMR